MLRRDECVHTRIPASAATLLSGSANFTLTDTHVNLNNVFIFHNAFVCRQYEKEVQQLDRGTFGRGMHGDVPATHDLSGIPVKVLFAPDITTLGLTLNVWARYTFRDSVPSAALR